jgi:hypothetical protein
MDIVLPPGLLYAVGALLVVLGGMRAYHLGWKRRERDEPESDDPEAAPRPKATADRRHITFGLIWLAMGLFLIVSTLIKARGR